VASLPPFQSLIDDHGRDVHRFLIANVGPIDADDCWQETWLSALRAYPSLRDATNLRSWLFTIAHRKAIDHARARGRRAVPVATAAELAGADPVPAAPLPDEQLWGSVAELPDKQRAAVTLRFVADSAYAEIGEVMGISEEAARRNVHEALKRLRKELDR
jgi:RNA polymerase sigma factor (sigma-70 family)